MSQLHTLFNLLRSASEDSYISKQDIIDVLKVSEASVPVYIFELKKQFKVNVEFQKDGKRILAYRLMPESRCIEAPAERKRGRRKKEVAPKSTAPVVDEYAETLKDFSWIYSEESV